MPSLFTGSHWFKGALHCHTDRSDGKVPPREILRRYRERGYSFAAMTDHDVFAHYPEVDHDGFLSIPGAEIIFSVSDFQDNIRGTHVVALAEQPDGPFGAIGPVDYQHEVDCAGMNRILKERHRGGNSLILAHPYWSWMDFHDVGRVEHCFAIEIFNALCKLEAISDGLTYWDWLLRRGRRIFGVAVDDHHSLGGDFAGGWVCVRADELSRRAIFESLLSGNFYSSTGPVILDFAVEGSKVTLRCQPAAAISFVAFGQDCYPMLGERGRGAVEYGEYALTGRESYVRAEVLGLDGSRAWTNPIFF